MEVSANRRFVLVHIKVPIEIFPDGEYALMEDCVDVEFSKLSAAPAVAPARDDLSEMYEHILSDILASFSAPEAAPEADFYAEPDILLLSRPIGNNRSFRRRRAIRHRSCRAARVSYERTRVVHPVGAGIWILQKTEVPSV